MNFLIEGDNLASLYLLEKTHKGKIDIIYIDPPYNTGNKDFVYDDNYIDTSDMFKHSKWLSFMKKRLKIAYRLLSQNGIIFISIDDIEQANLKVLCDDVFGEENFVNCVVNQSAKSVFGSKASAKDKTIIKTKDYILCYLKNKNSNFVFSPLYTKIENPIHMSHDFVFENGKKISTTAWFEKNYSDIFKKYNFPITKNNILKLLKIDENFYKEVFEKLLDIQYRTGGIFNKEIPNDIENQLKQGKIVKYGDLLLIKENDGKGKTSFLRTLRQSCNFSDDHYKEFCKVDILGDVWDNSQGYTNLKAESHGVVLNCGQKPINLIKRCLKLSVNKKSVVLDFFAGNATSGHAVMELNAEDGGNRKFILCNNNESNICREKTYERIKRAIENNNYKASLKYMKIDFVPITDKFYYEYADELLKNVKELVELENALNFNGNKELAIILTEEELDDFTNNIPRECKTIYLGHDILPTYEQETLFKKNKIKINIIPDYYYRDLEG